MEENFKNKLGFFVFVFLIISLAIGGYVFMNYVLHGENKEYKEEEKTISYKIDENKDYFYYINEETISESAEIFYKDVVINIKGQEYLNNSLKDENRIYKDTIRYITNDDLLVVYNNDNLHSLNFREYETFEYNNYVSLIIYDYLYTCYDNISFKSSKSYIFDTSTGKLMEEQDILKHFNITLEEIIKKIKTKLQKEENPDIILIDETLNNLNYSLYIDNYGNLYVTYLAKFKDIENGTIINTKGNMEVN